MKFSFNLLQSFFEKKVENPKKVLQALTFHSFEVVGMEKRGNDFIFDIDVLPNRTDCYSHYGLAREIAAICGLKIKEKRIKIKEDKNLKIDDFVLVKVKEGCERYSARLLFNVKVKESPRWLKQILINCGIEPINNVVDIANYVMIETGQPLHAFDFEKIEGGEIFVRFAKKGEKIVTFDGKEYELDEDILVISDVKKPLAIAGIKGGRDSGISKNTKIVLLESANFDPLIIKKASQKLNLFTEAAFRFSHGLDPNLTEIALNTAVYYFNNLYGKDGIKFAKGIIDHYKKKALTRRIGLDWKKVESVLGERITKNEILKILKSLGFKINKNFIVEIPTFRKDISLQEDLIEEIGRIYGYEQIKPKIPLSLLSPPKRNDELFWEKFIKDTLVSFGLTEVYNYSFVSQDDVDYFYQKDLIEIENPASSSYKFLRPSLLPGLLKNIQKNQALFSDIKIFEIGKVFKQQKEYKEEKKMIGAILMGDKFFEAKGIVDSLLKSMGITSFYFKPLDEKKFAERSIIWNPLRSAHIIIDGKNIGTLGEVFGTIIEKRKIKDKVVYLELDFERLARLATEEKEYEPFSLYPAIVRDISVFVPHDELVENVMNLIENSGGNLIRDIELFDIYEDEKENKKSLAFHLIFQLEDRAVSPEEVDFTMKKIIENLEKNSNFEVRKQ